MTDTLSPTGTPVLPLAQCVAIAVAKLKRHGEYEAMRMLEEAWEREKPTAVVDEIAAERLAPTQEARNGE